MLNLRCFARSDYRSPIYEFKILQFLGFAGINRSNDFQAYLAGLAVSSQNDFVRQKTEGQKNFPPHSILPCRPKIFKRPTSTKIQWIFDQLCPVSGKNGIHGGSKLRR